METYNNVIHNLRVQYVIIIYFITTVTSKVKTQNFDTKNYFLYKDHALLFIYCLLYSKNLEATDFILLILNLFVRNYIEKHLINENRYDIYLCTLPKQLSFCKYK